MLTLVRILSVVALGYGLFAALRNARESPAAGDLENAIWLAYCVLVGIFAALVWAPLIAGRMADPLVGTLIEGRYDEKKSWLIRLVRAAERRHWRAAVRWLCFLEGVRRPWHPLPFIVGLENARPGSWLERVYAREVYRFNNIQNCLKAYAILKRHGAPPPPHPNPTTQLAIAATERGVRPEAPVLPVPRGNEPPPIERNRRIQLFSGADSSRSRVKAESTPDTVAPNTAESPEPVNPAPATAEPGSSPRPDPASADEPQGPSREAGT